MTTKDPKRALIEDAEFLANLADLDYGMDEPSAPADGPDVDRGMGHERNEPPRPRQPALPPSPPRTSTPPSAGGPEPPRPARSALPPSRPVLIEPGRPLFDLFSPEMLLPDQSPSEAGSAIPPGQHSLVHDRRAFPLLDEPPEVNPRIRPSRTSDPLTGETFDGLHEQPFSPSTDPGFLHPGVDRDRLDERMVDSAAVDLDLAPSCSRTSPGRVAATLAVLALLCAIGAVAGAFVFRTDLSALISQWQAVPAPPAEVHPALSPPYKPVPPSEAEQQIR